MLRLYISMDLSVFLYRKQVHWSAESYITGLVSPFSCFFPPSLPYFRGTVQAYNSGSQGNIFHLGLAQGEIWRMMKMVWGLFLLILLDWLPLGVFPNPWYWVPLVKKNDQVSIESLLLLYSWLHLPYFSYLHFQVPYFCFLQLGLKNLH